MKKPIYVRPFTTTEQHALQQGLQSSDACVRRRCQLLFARARGQHARGIAETVGCDDQTVRQAIQAFTARGLSAVRRRSSAPPQTPHAVFTLARREPWRALLHQRPRPFGKPTSVWTLEWAAAVAYATGLTPQRVSGDTMRQVLAKFQARWKRAQHWSTSPDPAYARTKNRAIASSAWPPPIPSGCSALAMKSGEVAWRSRPCTPGRPASAGDAWGKKR